jgi:hypothetical protein
MPLMDYKRIKATIQEADNGMRKVSEHLGMMAEDAYRVRDVIRNAPKLIEDLDHQFEEVTKLTKTDITFLFLAVALQVARQILLPNDLLRTDASGGDNLVKDPIDKVIDAINNEDKRKQKKWHEILLGSVPYDAVNYSDKFKFLGIKTGIGGTTHRYRTLGHDPVLGWIFGTSNILTSSLTKNTWVDTYFVYDMKMAGFYPGGTLGMFNDVISGTAEDWSSKDIERKIRLPAAVVKQAIHFGADMFTEQGLPIPFISSLGSTGENVSKELLTRFHIDIYSTFRSMLIASFINAIIQIIHQLFYDETRDGNLDLYQVRTRKILSYSNIIASVSNIVGVAVASAIGAYTGNNLLVKGAINRIDIGGFIITLHRIATDRKFIAQVEQEFLEKEFYKIVMGDDCDF